MLRGAPNSERYVHGYSSTFHEKLTVKYVLQFGDDDTMTVRIFT